MTPAGNPRFNLKVSMDLITSRQKTELCSFFQTAANWLFQFEMTMRSRKSKAQRERPWFGRLSRYVSATNTIKGKPHVPDSSIGCYILDCQWIPFNQGLLSFILSPEGESDYENMCWVRPPFRKHHCQLVRCVAPATFPI